MACLNLSTFENRYYVDIGVIDIGVKSGQVNLYLTLISPQNTAMCQHENLHKPREILKCMDKVFTQH